MGALWGGSVAELGSRVAAPYCAKLLADLGARVVKVEAPGRGDDARQIGPFIGGRSAYFLPLNRGKQSLAPDLQPSPARAIFEAPPARARLPLRPTDEPPVIPSAEFVVFPVGAELGHGYFVHAQF